MCHSWRFKTPISACLLILVQALCCAAEAIAAAPAYAEVILRGGAIYTADPTRALAQAIALSDGKVLAVGTPAEVARTAGPNTRIVELAGRMVLPGLHDAHVHPMSAGLWFLRCRLNDALTLDELTRTIRACDAQRTQSEWFIARGWADASFDDVALARTFESAALKRPAALISARGERIWLNAAGLKRVGIDSSQAPAVDDGIGRDRSGRPNGFVSGAAAAQVRSQLPKDSERDYRNALRHVSALLNAHGVTSLTDASVSPPMLEAYRAAERAGELTVRVALAQNLPQGPAATAVAELRARRQDGHSHMLNDGLVKLFLDGDFAERGAALLEPYADAPNNLGELNRTPAELKQVVIALDAAGFDLHLHAIGDRAVRGGLDAIQAAIRANGARDRRHQIAHVALVNPADLPRFKALAVIANLQLAWAKPDEDSSVTAPKRLGPQRAARQLAFADLLKHRAMLVAGSDGPLPTMNPFEAIQIAATRRAADGTGAALEPAQALRVRDLLQMLTRNGAFAVRAERFSGQLLPGYAADLIVIDQNLLEIPVEKIAETQVLLTLLAGRPVHTSTTFPWPKPPR